VHTLRYSLCLTRNWNSAPETKMTATRVLQSLLAVTLLVTAVASATNTWFASRGAIANMNDADREILTAAIDDILNNQADGSSSEWSNPDTGSGGTLQVAGTHEDFGTTCRLLRMESTANSITRRNDFRLCKDKEGGWRFAPNKGSS